MVEEWDECGGLIRGLNGLQKKNINLMALKILSYINDIEHVIAV